MSSYFDVRRGWRETLRYSLGKLFTRIEGYGAVYKEAIRRDALTAIASIDSTANIAPLAGILNSRGDPKDIVIGANSALLGELITFPQAGRILIGERTFIGPGARIWSAKSIRIGSHVLIAHNVNIHDNISHSLNYLERRQEIDQVLPNLKLVAHPFDLKAGSITIESDVWIGFGASIIGGVTIGKGAIIGAATMVTRDVEPNSVVVGNPMRVVKLLHQDH